MNDWQPMDTMPKDGRAFLIAEYAPTSWVYVVRHVRPLPYLNANSLERFLERSVRYARGWMPAPAEPVVRMPLLRGEPR